MVPVREDASSGQTVRYQDLIDNLPNIIFEVDQEGGITYVNATGYSLTGYNKNDVKRGLNIFQLLVPEDRDRAFNNFSRILSGKASKGNEYTLLKKDNDRLQVLVHSHPITKGKKVVGLRGIVTDISELKRAREIALEKERQFKTVIKNIKGAIYRCLNNRNWTMHFLSSPIESIVGYPASDFINDKKRSYASVIHPDDRKEVNETVKSAVKERKSFRIVYRVVDSEGRIHWVRERGVGVYDEKGRLRWLEGVIFDITEEKRMQDEIKASEKRFRDTLDNMMEGCQIISPDFRYLYVNDSAAKHGRTTRKQLIGNNMGEVYPGIEKTKMFSTLRRCMTERVSARMENVFEYPDGEKRVFKLSFQPVPEGLFILSFDITDQKRMEEEIKRHTEDLEQLLEERTRELRATERRVAVADTAVAVAHDLRNPLQTIRFASFNVARKHPKLHPKLDVIQHSVDYADGIVRKLLDYSHTQFIEYEPVNVNELLDEVLNSIHAPDNVAVLRKYEGSAKISADKNGLSTVFQSIISNAFQAMPEGGNLTIKTMDRKRDLEVTFRDTGKGIPKRDISKLFKPFYTTKSTGMGLGLAISKRIVDAHKGTILVKSRVGKGTEFTLRLPKSTG